MGLKGKTREPEARMTTGGVRSAAVLLSLLLVAAVVAFSWGRGEGAEGDTQQAQRVAARALAQVDELEGRLGNLEEELAELREETAELREESARFDRLGRRLDRVRDRLQASLADLRGSLDGVSSTAEDAASRASSAASRIERVARDLSVLTKRFDYHVRNH